MPAWVATILMAVGAARSRADNRPMVGEIAPLTSADVAALADEVVELTNDTIERLRKLVLAQNRCLAPAGEGCLVAD